MNPALNTMAGLGQPLNIAGTPKPVNPYQPVTTASSVFAPNVGSYAGDGTDDAADDSTDDSTDDGTGTDETEEERRRRLAAQNSGDGGDNPEEYRGATTVFGGTSQNGMIRGGKQYQLAYESSSKQKVPGMIGALMNIGNLDQVRLTDPTTGQSVSMSKAKYDSMKENRTDASNINFIDTLMQNQAGIDYNRTRAGAIAPFKTGLAVAGEALGFGNAPGTSVAEQNEYARSLAGSLGIDYNGQSMAEVMASPEYNAPKQGGPSPVFREDSQGNLVPDTRFSTPQGLSIPDELSSYPSGMNNMAQGVQAPSVFQGPMGLGVPDELASYPSGMNNMAKNITQANTERANLDRAMGVGQAMNVGMSPGAMGGTSNFYDTSINTFGSPQERALAQSVTPAGNTVAYTPDEAGRLASFVSPSGNTSAVARQTDDIFGNPALSGGYNIPDELGSYPSGMSGRQRVSRGYGADELSNPAISGGYNVPDEVGAYTQGMSGGYNVPDEVGAYTQGMSGRQRSYQGSGDFDTPDNQGANMDDDAPAASRDMSTREGRKAAADDSAREQTGDSRSTAVTDKDGNPVTSGGYNGIPETIVTNTPPKADNSGGGNDKSIVCTEMYRQTQLDDWDKAMKIWYIYQKKYLTPLHEIGYHWLFKPYVRGMRTSSILTNLGAFFAQKRTEHLKYILTKGKSKDSLIGNIWCKIIHPIVYMVGKIVYKK
jgi:hypothetical protein